MKIDKLELIELMKVKGGVSLNFSDDKKKCETKTYCKRKMCKTGAVCKSKMCISNAPKKLKK